MDRWPTARGPGSRLVRHAAPPSLRLGPSRSRVERAGCGGVRDGDAGGCDHRVVCGGPLVLVSLEKAREGYLAALDRLGPFRGPCAFCGSGDARHRVADAITGFLAAGDDPEAVAAEYGVSVEAVFE